MPDAGRVIAGVARGIRLDAPGPATRPLADRVKQTLFAILEPDLPGANVLDLFAGSGAAGLEALSRGAAHATFVERDKAAAAIIATNLGRTHLAGARARIVRAEAIAWLGGPDAAAAGPFGIVVVDPPYAEVRACSRRPSTPWRPCWHRARASWPSTSGATRRPPGSGC